MITAAVALEILDVIKLAPQAIDTFAAFFRSNPSPTTQQVADLIAECRADAEARRASVAAFDADDDAGA
jgi:hypothetical protein